MEQRDAKTEEVAQTENTDRKYGNIVQEIFNEVVKRKGIRPADLDTTLDISRSWRSQLTKRKYVMTEIFDRSSDVLGYNTLFHALSAEDVEQLREKNPALYMSLFGEFHVQLRLLEQQLKQMSDVLDGFLAKK